MSASSLHDESQPLVPAANHLQSLLDKALPFLRRELKSVDPNLPSHLSILCAAGTGEVWHRTCTLLDHLLVVHRVLKLWGAPDSVASFALFHNSHNPVFSIFKPLKTRDALRDIVGGPAERLIHFFCLIPRSPVPLADSLLSHYTDEELAEHLKDSEASARNAEERGFFDGEEAWRRKIKALVPTDGIVVQHRRSGEDVRVPRRVAAVLLMVFVGDISDQNVRYAARGSELEAIWPGDCKPGLWMSWISRVVCLYRLIVREEEIFIAERKKDVEKERDEDLELVVPPVFGNCTRVLSADDEVVARDLYWEAVCGGRVLEERAEELLLRCVERNPFVGEPHLGLAQIYLGKGRVEEAERETERGLCLLLEWGSAWDKRVSWEGWISWGRLLLKRAKQF